MLTKKRTLLDSIDVEEDIVTFSPTMDDGEENIDPVNFVVISMSREAWEQMHEPRVVTVTIEPGDRLNETWQAGGTLVTGALNITKA